MATRRIYLDPKTLMQLYDEERLGIDAIAARLGTSHGTVWRSMERYGIARRGLSEAITRHNRTNFSGNKNEMAYLIGFRIGDLWVHKNKPGIGSRTIVVSCHSSRDDQIALVRSLFSTYGHIRITRSKWTQQILCYLNLTFEFLLPKYNNIPAWLLRRPEHFFSFLGGYVDAEGSFCVDRLHRASFQMKSYDVHILAEIASYLSKRANIKCNPPRRAQVRGSPTGKGYTLRKDAWVISIANQKTLNTFCQLILPYLKHAKRIRDLCKVQEHLCKQMGE